MLNFTFLLVYIKKGVIFVQAIKLIKNTEIMKSENQLTAELLERNDVKELKNNLTLIYTKSKYTVSTHSGELTDIVSFGDTLLELISRNSNDFTKDIAGKCLENEYNPTEKQAWCLAFQIKNNIEVYKIAMQEFSEECLKALESLDQNEVVEVVAEPIITLFRADNYTNNSGNIAGIFTLFGDAKSELEFDNLVSEAQDGNFSQITEFTVLSSAFNEIDQFDQKQMFGLWKNGDIVRDYYFI